MKAIGPLFLMLALAASPTFARNAAVADDIPNKSLEAKPDVPVYFNPKDMENPKDWKRIYFDVVVVINKAYYAQTIDVWRFGEHMQLSSDDFQALVSTGLEIPVHADPSNPKAPVHDYFSQTFTGYFNVERLDIDHHSTTWLDAFMPWAVFFDGGIATHRSPHENLEHRDKNGRLKPIIDPNIGERASGGCVRLHEQTAKDVFWWVRLSGGPFLQEEYDRPHEEGEPDFYEEAQQQPDVKSQDLPYNTPPQVPVMNRDGSMKMKNGALVWKYGYRTLYIVEDIAPEGEPNPVPKKARSQSLASPQRRAEAPTTGFHPFKEFLNLFN